MTDSQKLENGSSPTHAVEVLFLSKKTAAKFAKTVQDGDLAGFATFSAGDPVALTGEPTAQPGAKVWTLNYSHKHGEDVSVYASEAAAKAAVHGIARQYWDDFSEGEKMPRGRDAAIEAYFEYAEGYEGYSIEQTFIF